MDNKRECAACGKELKIHWSSTHPDSTICDECQKELVERHNAEDHFERCPFCGGNEFKYILRAPYYYGAEGVKIKCKGCGAEGGWGEIRTSFLSPEGAVFNRETIENGFKRANEKWNKRA